MTRLRWGVIGAGGIADRRTLPGMLLATNAELVAVMEVERESAEALRQKYGARRAYTTAEDLLSDSDVQAVYIASPVAYHRDQAIMAASKGKHILLEKPLALSLDEAKEIMAACDGADIVAGSGLMMRFSAIHRWMRDCVSSGRLGKVVSCRAQLTCWYPDMPGSWRQKLDTSGGGALMDLGVHCVDLLSWIVDSPAVRVAALSGTHAFGYEVEDSATMLFECEAGAFCTVESYFCIPDAAARCRLEVYGTKGSLLAEGSISQLDGGRLEAFLPEDTRGYDAAQARDNAVEPQEITLAFGNLYTSEIEQFSRAVLEGSPAPVTLQDAYAAQEAVVAAYHSAATGEFVNLRKDRA